MKYTFQFPVLIIRMRRVKRKKSDFVALREFFQDVVAADFTANIRRHKSTCFDPENSHFPVLCRRYRCGRSILDLQQVNERLIGAQLLSQFRSRDGLGADYDNLCIGYYRLHVLAQQ